MGKTIKLANDTYLVNDLYSITEKRVGTWINGKPIYRKVVHLTTVAGVNSFGTISNLDELIDIKGAFTDGYNKLPSNFYFNQNSYIITWINQTVLYYWCEGYVGFNGNIVIEYTKTTD